MRKVVILAGGMGTRLAEHTEVRPKPMVEIGGRPIIWHIMKQYAHHGFNEFVLALGYKGEYIKRYFLDYHTLAGDMTVRLDSGELTVKRRAAEPWTIHLMDTGAATMTGGRVKRLQGLIGDERFLLTYGDGVCNVDLKALMAFHEAHGKLATVTAVRPPARFGGLVFNGDMVSEFTEKPQIGEGWINGGFMVLEPGVFDYLKRGDETVLEADALEDLARDGQLAAYRHGDFWQCMDTVRDLQVLQKLWESGHAPWRLWE
ncbi:MAG TPA: glucose-1-phosphate cytidylyltransferase [Polyangiaceae bacterium]|nr:glucose-1-phosphate cytidylyltransferase [Polyangiaceae bacterium]